MKPHLFEAVLSDLNGLSATVFERGHWVSSFGSLQAELGEDAAEAALGTVQPVLESRRLGVGLRPQRLQLRAAAIARGTQVDSQPCMIALLWSANSRSLVSSSNIALV